MNNTPKIFIFLLASLSLVLFILQNFFGIYVLRKIDNSISRYVYNYIGDEYPSSSVDIKKAAKRILSLTEGGLVGIKYDVLYLLFLESNDSESEFILEIEYKSDKRIAYIVFPDRPMVFSAKNIEKDIFSVFGIESKYPVDVKGFHKGFLLGYRIKPFDGSNALDVSDLRVNKLEYTVCPSIEAWAAQTGVKRSDIKILSLESPKKVMVVDHALRFEAQNSSNLTYILRHCDNLP